VVLPALLCKARAFYGKTSQTYKDRRLPVPDGGFVPWLPANMGDENTPQPEYTVETTPYVRALRLPLDASLVTATDFRACRNRDFYDEGCKKQVGYETVSVFYLGFFRPFRPKGGSGC